MYDCVSFAMIKTMIIEIIMKIIVIIIMKKQVSATLQDGKFSITNLGSVHS